jgi:peptidoglycan hydrolase-like protein with peptidoglycan-binding domain
VTALLRASVLAALIAAPAAAQTTVSRDAVAQEVAVLLRDLSLSVDPGRGLVMGDRAPCVADGPQPCAPDPRVRRLQERLAALGLDPGPADGLFGPRTARAVGMLVGQPAGTRTDGDLSAAVAGGIILGAMNTRVGPPPHTGSAIPASVAPDSPATAPVPTRAFAGPDQFPPAGFRGYGFLAFPARATEFDRDRHMILCQAYVSSLPTPGEVPQARWDQFVTVWPVLTADEADAMNLPVHRSDAGTICARAIDGYDANRARAVIAMVRQVDGAALEGRGPFLFGWIPATDFGAPGKLILMLDLSRVTTYEQALTQLQGWRQQVETNPDLLRNGYSLENVRRVLRNWADQHGEEFLLLIRGE